MGLSLQSVKLPVAFVTLAVVLKLSPQAVLPQTRTINLPTRLEDSLARVVKPNEAERKSLIAGKPISKLLDSDPNFEVSVLGAIWIDAPIQRYVDAIQDIANFERGEGFNFTKKMSTIPRLDDFAAMRLPPEDVADIRGCRAGDCDVKLSAEAMKRFQRGNRLAVAKSSGRG